LNLRDEVRKDWRKLLSEEYCNFVGVVKLGTMKQARKADAQNFIGKSQGKRLLRNFRRI
jgi:hypothetical protein